MLQGRAHRHSTTGTKLSMLPAPGAGDKTASANPAWQELLKL